MQHCGPAMEDELGVAHFTAIVAVGLWGGVAEAANMSDFALKTTEDLYQVCTVAPEDPLHREALDLCEGFLIGAVSYHDAVSDREHLKRLICYPATVTRDQGIQVFVDWAATHQQDRKFMNDPAVYGVVRGLAAKWPCK
jgi:Rap1a immunity proteins